MKASETKFQNIIEGIKQFIVPLFERSYSWQTKEWNALWEDLKELCSEENPKDHFMGSMVTMPTQSVPEGVSKFLLIDGQQRLTTLFIILALIRDKSKDLPGDLSKEIQDIFLTNLYKEGLDSLKLLPTQADRDSFVRIMRGETDLLENQITKAYRYFERMFRADSCPNMEKLKKTIITKLLLVSIVLDPNDNPHLIFESLNYKGRPLSQADLIRNYFFMKVHVSHQEEIYRELWRPMQDRLGEDMTEFMRHYLMREGVFVKESDVYWTLKQTADSKDEPQIKEYLKDIARFADYYSKLLKPEQEKHHLIRAGIMRLNRLEVTTAYPFLLNVYDDYAGKTLSAEDFCAVLDVLENYIIRRFVCGLPTHGHNKILPAAYAQAKINGNLVEGLKQFLSTRNYPRDVEFEDRFKSSKIYAGADRIGKASLLLERLESSFRHREPVSFQNLTIEHVLPQTLSNWWKTKLGPDWEVTHDLWLHTIGNLTLSGYNSEMSNSPYPQKQEALRNSHLELNKYFAKVKEWDEESIKDRAGYLAKRAIEVWPYFGAEKESNPSDNFDVTGKTPISISILGEKASVSSWREVAQKTLETIFIMDPDKIDLLITNYPRFIGRDSSKFRTSKKVCTGLYMETNLSATSINKFCIQIGEMAGLSSDDWSVECS